MPTQIRKMRLKICVVGDRAVGKTSLIQRYVFDTFTDAYHGTLGTKMHLLQFIKEVAAQENVEADVALFDIMGEHGARDLYRDALFWGAHGFLTVADVTRPDTFESLIEWVNSVRAVAGDVPYRILLNKSDLLKAPGLPSWVASRLTVLFPNVPYSMVSAKTGAEVERAMGLFLGDVVNGVLEESRARRAGRIVGNRILTFAAKRGALGVTKNELLAAFKGTEYNALMSEISNLERAGLVTLEQSGPASFRVVLTADGEAASKQFGMHQYIVDEVP